MNELWIVRFVRKDGKPDEEYYYRSLAEAASQEPVSER